jgi:hypothetical protein
VCYVATRPTAPSLRLSVPNSLTASPLPFLPRAVLLMTSLFSDAVPPRWSSSTATSAPSLRPARPERFAAKVLVDPASQIHPELLLPFFTLFLIHTVAFSLEGTLTPGVVGAPPYPATLTLMLFLLPFRRGSTPSTVSISSSLVTHGRFRLHIPCSFPRKYHICPSCAILRFPEVLTLLGSSLCCCWCFSSFSSGVAAPQHVGSLCPCCVHFSARVSLCGFCL